jgi:23S rRNA pseudouridine2604 synthase
MEEAIRINKYLSEAGYCSRRQADRLVGEGRVTIDGKIAQMGDKVTDDQKVMVGKQRVLREEPFIMIALNKPKGIVCTTAEVEKDNVVRFLNFKQRIYPVGRLDKDSEGLLLLTNQGELANELMKARNYHEKEYVVRVNKPLTKDFIKAMRDGVPILDTVTRPCKARYVDKYTFEIILTQGLNRQIRRMCEYFGYRVVALKRIRIVNIELGKLKTGQWRYLTDNEIQEMKGLLKHE